jgi:predicted amidohydrolase YtcJ
MHGNLLSKRFLIRLCAGVFAGAALSAQAAEKADRIWHGGSILTMNDAAMRAEAIAVKDGKILAVGDEANVMKTRGRGTEVIDLAGRAIVPGFVDAHGHVFMGGIQALSANMLAPPDGEVTDIASLQQTLREWVVANQETVDRIQLIFGFGYDNSMLAELRHPTREDLDAVSTEYPVCIIHQSGHLAAVNSKALELSGITAETPDPDGGVIQRKAGSQEPNGVLEETAAFPVIMKLLAKTGAEGAEAFARNGSKLWARFGYTTADEGRAVPTVAKVLRGVADAGGFDIDIVTYIDVLSDRDFIIENVSQEYRNRLRIGGAKLTIDGSPQGFTAWRDRPYYSPVGNYPPGYVGYPAVKSEQVIDAAAWAYKNNIQLLVHSNGEAATDLLIAALRAAENEYGAGDRRPILIHGQFQREDQVASYQKLGLHPSLFPMHTFYWGDWHREHTVGPERADHISPVGWALARGMKFSSHHDAPVAFPDSMRVLDATVTRRSRTGDILGAEHRVDVITGLKAMTIWPAWQHFEEDQKGSLETGKLADLVILSRDPTEGDVETIDQIKVLETIKEGRTIFALTAEEEQKAARMLRPDDNNETALSRYLRRASGHVYGTSGSHAAHASCGEAEESIGSACGCTFVAELGALLAETSRYTE